LSGYRAERPGRACGIPQWLDWRWGFDRIVANSSDEMSFKNDGGRIMLTMGTILSATAAWRPTLGGILLVGAMLSGCAANSGTTKTSDATNANSAAKAPELIQTDPVLAFVGSAKDFEVSQVTYPATGAKVQVFAGRKYNAASGRPCRHYRISDPTKSTPHKTALACQNHSGRWQRIPPLLNTHESIISINPQ
jgi:hypothetical protein